MGKHKTMFRCSACGHEVGKWVGRCAQCGEWGTIAQAAAKESLRSGLILPTSPAKPIAQVDVKAVTPKPTGVPELDRVLGGGIVPGSVILLSGEPGVGKSTLLLEVVRHWADRAPADRALYVTGEESAGQVRLRADRTGAITDDLYLTAESDLAAVLGHVEQVAPTLLVVDSVQTMLASDTDGASGGVGQVRAVTATLTSLAKTSGIAVLLIGHVTKDGAIAGPRTLEHLVDVVLHFEGDRHGSLRTIRGLKNRFGSVDEIGCFELHDDGIRCVTDPSGIFCRYRGEVASGTAITVAMDGKRPLPAEVQALTTKSNIPVPRRAVSGLDFNRVAMVLAVLTRRCRVYLSEQEVYASTVGGMRLVEPGSDLAVALAIASAYRDQPLPHGTVVMGEVGLVGEIRAVGGLTRRLAEAHRLGFTRALIPAGQDPISLDRMHIERVSTLDEALRTCGLVNSGAHTATPPPVDR